MGGVIGITSEFSTSVDRSAALLHFFEEHMVDSLFKQSRVFSDFALDLSELQHNRRTNKWLIIQIISQGEICNFFLFLESEVI